MTDGILRDFTPDILFFCIFGLMDLSIDWVVGFVDGEGCFYVGFNKQPEMTTGIQVLPEFRIVQHKRDIQILYGLKKFFRCGVVRQNHDDRYELRIRKLGCLAEVVQFFENHSLKTKKHVDFKKFARIVHWMSTGKHLKVEGVIQIIELAMQMNTQNQPKTEKLLVELKQKTG